MSPAFPIQTDACISLYGDSFVWSQDVKNEYTWGNRLSQATNCRVSNFGVNGYGTDQAFLRYRHNLKDDAPVVILGHMSENIRRNVNRYRHLLSPPASYGLKPRFVLDHEKTLELLPMPTISERAFLDFVENPENYLQSEFFLPNGPSGLSKLEFPYFWSLLQAFGDYRISARLRGGPGYVEFYSPGHPSQGLGVTAGILEAFYREAIRRGQRPLVILIPTRFDLIEYRESRHWIYKSLLSLSEERYIQTINLGDGILEYLGDRHPDELFSYPGLYYGSHFNNEGNGIIAEIVYRYLLEGEYLP